MLTVTALPTLACHPEGALVWIGRCGSNTCVLQPRRNRVQHLIHAWNSAHRVCSDRAGGNDDFRRARPGCGTGIRIASCGGDPLLP